MPWLQVRVVTDGEHVEAVESALERLGAHAVTLEDAGEQALLEPMPGETPLWNAVAVVGLFDDDADRDGIEAALGRVEHLGTPLEPRFAQIADREWSRVWLDDWQPLRFGRRLWVAPVGAHVPEAGGDAVIVRLDPGLAFGTGTHATTALCLEWLDGRGLDGETVLDHGCGSGILAIAALRLGARFAVAADIDPQALEATRENARVNGVAERLETVEAARLDDRTYSVILANILAGPLTELATAFARRQLAGGDLVLAGILSDQAASVCAAHEPAYRIDVGAERDGWVRLEGVRRR